MPVSLDGRTGSVVMDTSSGERCGLAGAVAIDCRDDGLHDDGARDRFHFDHLLDREHLTELLHQRPASAIRQVGLECPAMRKPEQVDLQGKGGVLMLCAPTPVQHSGAVVIYVIAPDLPGFGESDVLPHAAAAVSLMLDFIKRTQRESERNGRA
jgi:hypothetical protein